MPRTVTERQVAAFRLSRHHLDRRAASGRLATVVGDVGGIQAQLASAARVGLWCRVGGLAPEDVDRALWKEKTLVKTWAMRGAVHLLPTQDLPLFLEGLRREGLLREKQWMSRYGLKEEDFPRMSAAIQEALASGPMTRKELADTTTGMVGEWGRPWIEHGYGGVVRLACLEGRVCFGPNRDREITFVRTDEWLPSLEETPLPDAEAELLRRYLHGFGPATPQDYAAWSGMRVRPAQATWKRLGEAVTQVSVAGREGSLLAEDVDRLLEAEPPEPPSVRLLPHFDAFLLGHRDKGHLVAEARYKRVYRKAGWISPPVLADGRIAGTWEAKHRTHEIDLTVVPFGELPSDARDALSTEAEALGRFHGRRVRLRVERTL